MTPPQSGAVAVPVLIDRNTTIYFEAAGTVLPTSESAIEEAGAPTAAAERGIDATGALVPAIVKLCETIMKGFDGIDDERLRPAAATVEFTIAVSVEGNVKVVKGGAEAGIKVTAQWERARTPAG